MEGARFEDTNAVISYVQEWIRIKKKFGEQGIKQLSKRWKKCMEANGDYFEG